MRSREENGTVTRVVGYVRVSTEQQADGGISLEAQRKRLEGYASLYELELVEIVVDAGVSAKSLDRPGLRKVMAMLDEGEVDGVLVAKLDRLTRSVRDLGELLDRYFREGRAALLSVAENVDTRTAGGRLVLIVLGSVAQWEREAIGERTRDALSHLKREGVRLGGEALGWTRERSSDEHGRRVLREVEGEAETVGTILALHDAGRTLRQIARELARIGRPTKRGGRWHASTVRAILVRSGATA